VFILRGGEGGGEGGEYCQKYNSKYNSWGGRSRFCQLSAEICCILLSPDLFYQ